MIKTNNDKEIENLLLEARILKEFFDQLINDITIEPFEITNQLIQENDIPSKIKKDIEAVASRVNKAVLITSYLTFQHGGSVKERLFTVENFRNPQLNSDLYKAVYGEDINIEDLFFIEEHSFALGFYIAHRLYEEKINGTAIGDTEDAMYNKLFSTEGFLNITLEQINSGKKKIDYLNRVCYRIDYETLQVHCTELIKTKQHELKHIIDKLLALNVDFELSELSADLFSGSLENYSLEFDTRHNYAKQKKAIETKQGLEELHAPPIIIKNAQKSIDEYQILIQNVLEFPLNIVKECCTKLDAKTVSYIISIVPFSQLAITLDKVHDYL